MKTFLIISAAFKLAAFEALGICAFYNHWYAIPAGLCFVGFLLTANKAIKME